MPKLHFSFDSGTLPWCVWLFVAVFLAAPTPVWAADGPLALAGIPFVFVLFALTLAGVAIFHRHTLAVALSGLGAITVWKLVFEGFAGGGGLGGLGAHLAHEWVILANLLGLLVGFALLSQHFRESRLPDILPDFLPDDWKGGFFLLLIVFVLSSFLDNIAAAVIGGAMASAVYRGKVHLGFVAAIVAVSNAGGSGSVVGDTTTTMMWIAGISPLAVLDAYVAAVVAALFCAFIAAQQQQRYAPIRRNARLGLRVDGASVGIVLFILASAIAANTVVNLRFPEAADRFPFIGAAVWLALIVSAPLRRPAWERIPDALKSSAFLLALVLAASMMPVQELPAASWQTTLGLGFVSAVFDNIPLTALAIKQGGYDWGMLAYAVGFGGSMVWFGSSAGVALSTLFPESRSVGAWLWHGWHVAVAYVLGFLAFMAIIGWHPA